MTRPRVFPLAWSQIGAIVWAQWRCSWNRLLGVNKRSAAIAAIIGVFWYGGVIALAVGAGILMAAAGHQPYLPLVLSSALLLMLLYWQIAPVLMASTGASLDLRKILVYPVPAGALYGLEVLLRVTTGAEIIMILAGAMVGSLFNRRLPFWAPAGFLLFIVFNLLLAAGVRDLLVRLFANKRFREIAMFLLVTLAALPQVLMFTGILGKVRLAMGELPTVFLPWDAATAMATGRALWWTPLVLIGWILLSLIFGRYQFARSVRAGIENTAASGAAGRELLGFLYTWPGRLLRDPLGAMVEKELRMLTRSSRFRVVFAMGFTLGLLIWIPMSLGSRGHNQTDTFASANFLAIVSGYAVMLLTDLLFFNCLGPDRAAAQIYYLVPVPLVTVLVAKNVAASFFAVAELAIVTTACLLWRLPVTLARIAEAFSVCLVMCVLLLAVGNMASIWNPRPVNMSQPFRNQSSRVQWMALVAFPLACIPAALAYLARFAFESEAAFFGVLVVFGAAGAYVYRLALEVAVRHGELDREHIIEQLSYRAGIVAD